MPTPTLHTLEKAFELLSEIAERGESLSISAMAAKLGMPRSSAHRIVASFERLGLAARLRRGYYLPGPSLRRLAALGTLQRFMKAAARPILAHLARETRCVAHLGVLEEGMVTYLLKQATRATPLFTREGTQLEAYCTSIGKVLLAALPPEQLADYLKAGPFIRLTPHTLVSPPELRHALADVTRLGYATDDGEMADDLACLAVPVRSHEGRVLSSISLCAQAPRAHSHLLLRHLKSLQDAAQALGRYLSVEEGRPVAAAP